MKTTEEKIKDLTDKFNNDLENLKLKSEISDKMGIDVNTCFDSMGKKIITFDVTTFSQARTIRNYFDNEPLNNAVLKFSGKANLPTFSPFTLSFDNSDYEGRALSNSCKIQFSGYWNKIPCDVWIKINPRKYHGDILANDRRQLKHLGFGRYSSKNIIYLDMFGKQKYYGDHVTNYASCPEEKEEFEFTIFNGHVPEFVKCVNDEEVNP